MSITLHGISASLHGISASPNLYTISASAYQWWQESPSPLGCHVRHSHLKEQCTIDTYQPSLEQVELNWKTDQCSLVVAYQGARQLIARYLKCSGKFNI